MSKEVMQMALDALYENTTYSMQGDPVTYQDQRNDDTIEALRTALAQPEQMVNGLTEEETNQTMSVKGLAQPEPEPIGHFYINDYGNWEQSESNKGTPFYEYIPPQRKPLTDEEIYLATNHIDRNERGWAIQFARAIEAAHGIGEVK